MIIIYMELRSAIQSPLMSPERFLLDTVFIQALLNKKDSYHQQALAFLPRMRAAAQVWVTEAILIEVGDALSAIDRPAAVAFIQDCYLASNVYVAGVDSLLLGQALHLYETRSDKTWGLTDC